MTGGQGALTLDDSVATGHAIGERVRARFARPARCSCCVRARQEQAAHEGLLRLLDKASGGRTAWRTFEPVAEPAVAAAAIA